MSLKNRLLNHLPRILLVVSFVVAVVVSEVGYPWGMSGHRW